LRWGLAGVVAVADSENDIALLGRVRVHRALAADSELAQTIAVLAQAQQNAVWRRSKATNELRSVLHEYYPGFLDAFAEKSATNLAKPEARAVLTIAPTPADTAKLTKARVGAALRRARRKRGINELAADIVERLRAPQLRQPELVEKAIGRQALPCWRCSTPPAPAPTHSNKQPPNNSATTPTTPSSPVSPVEPT